MIQDKFSVCATKYINAKIALRNPVSAESILIT